MTDNSEKRVTAYRRTLNKALEQNRAYLHGKVLNLGGGRWQYRELAKDMVCVDLHSENQAGFRIYSDVIADAETALPFAQGSFDAVLCLNLLEHLRNPRAVIENARTVLKKGGKLIVAVPFMQHWHPDPNDYWRFTKEGLNELFGRGFKVIKIEPMGGRFVYFHHFLDYHGLPQFISAAAFPLTMLLSRMEHRKEKWAAGFFAVAEKA